MNTGDLGLSRRPPSAVAFPHPKDSLSIMKRVEMLLQGAKEEERA